MFYGAFLNLHDKRCTVVGGGKVAARKIRKLLASGAKVSVISPQLHDEIQQWETTRQLRHVARRYQTDDVAGSDLVFAATNDRHVNALVKQDAARLRIWCNVADNLDACDFIVPATLEHQGAHMAFSTSGVSPAAAKALRDALTADLADGGKRFYDMLKDFTERLQLPRDTTAD